MTRKPHILRFLFVFLCSVSLTLAASATSFCKCTCFSNSTIIQLDGSSPTSTAVPAGTHLDSQKGRGTCNECNRKFCLSYNLPICKGAKEEDVFTTCFQRDSAKDEAVVFIFIVATVGLLAYAAVRPWVDRWAESWRERRSYIPISNAGADES